METQNADGAKGQELEGFGLGPLEPPRRKASEVAAMSEAEADSFFAAGGQIEPDGAEDAEPVMGEGEIPAAQEPETPASDEGAETPETREPELEEAGQDDAADLEGVSPTADAAELARKLKEANRRARRWEKQAAEAKRAAEAALSSPRPAESAVAPTQPPPPTVIPFNEKAEIEAVKAKAFEAFNKSGAYDPEQGIDERDRTVYEYTLHQGMADLAYRTTQMRVDGEATQKRLETVAATVKDYIFGLPEAPHKRILELNSDETTGFNAGLRRVLEIGGDWKAYIDRNLGGDLTRRMKADAEAKEAAKKAGTFKPSSGAGSPAAVKGAGKFGSVDPNDPQTFAHLSDADLFAAQEHFRSERQKAVR